MNRRSLFKLIAAVAASAVMYQAMTELGHARESGYSGHVAELLTKATNQSQLDQAVTREDKEILLQAMRPWGALDQNFEYKKGLLSSKRRGEETALVGQIWARSLWSHRSLKRNHGAR
jgi:monoamine oxidase